MGEPRDRCVDCDEEAGEGLNYLQFDEAEQVWRCIECLETRAEVVD